MFGRAPGRARKRALSVHPSQRPLFSQSFADANTRGYGLHYEDSLEHDDDHHTSYHDDDDDDDFVQFVPFPYNDDDDDDDTDDLKFDQVATFNVGGTVFQTLHRTIFKCKQYEGRLSDPQYLKRHYDVENDEYFFDKDPRVFRVLLNYMRTGLLHVPNNICYPLMKSELEYWGVAIAELEPCCWARFSNQRKALKNLQQLEMDLQPTYKFPELHQLSGSCPTRLQRFKNSVWLLISDHSSSWSALAYASVSFTIVAVSVVLICIKTVTFDVLTRQGFIYQNDTCPIYHEQRSDDVAQSTAEALNCILSGDTSGKDVHGYQNECVYQTVICIFEQLCLLFFTIEMALGAFSCPDKMAFFKDKLVIADIFALMPDFFLLVYDISQGFHPCHYDYDQYLVQQCQIHRPEILENTDAKNSSTVSFSDVCPLKKADAVRNLKLLNLFRMARVMRLLRRVPGMWVMLYTIKTSTKELFLIICLTLVSTYTFACLLYFIEEETTTETEGSSGLGSIPAASYYAIITLSTIGYGDVYPRTWMGKIVGSICAITGSFLVSLTIPTLIANFMSMYLNIKYMVFKEYEYIKHHKNGKKHSRRHKTAKINMNIVSNMVATMANVRIVDVDGSTTASKESTTDSMHKDIDQFNFFSV